MATFQHFSALSFRSCSVARSHRICGWGHTSDASAPLAPAVLLNHGSPNHSCVSCFHFTQHNCCWKTNPLSLFNLWVFTAASSLLVPAIQASPPVRQSDLLLRKRKGIRTDFRTIWEKTQTRTLHFQEKATWCCLSLSGTESGEWQTSLPDRNIIESPK